MRSFMGELSFRRSLFLAVIDIPIGVVYYKNIDHTMFTS